MDYEIAIDFIFLSSGVKAFLHIQGHTILFMLMVYLACTGASKFLPFSSMC